MVESPPTPSRPESPGGSCTQAWMLGPVIAPPDTEIAWLMYWLQVVAKVRDGNVNGLTLASTPPPRSGVLPDGSTPVFAFDTPTLGYCGVAMPKSSTATVTCVRPFTPQGGFGPKLLLK